jgi:hypothetical protein
MYLMICHDKLQKSRITEGETFQRKSKGTSEAVTANVYAASILTLQNAYEAQSSQLITKINKIKKKYCR